MNPIEINAGSFAGRFKLIKTTAEGQIVETDWIDNLITDYGLNYILSVPGRSLGTNMVYLAVGTSSVTPAGTDTSLGAQAGTRTATKDTNVNGNSGSPLFYSFTRNTFRFTQGQVTGNLTEVGLFETAAGNTAATRALILDSEGNPTSFTVLANEILSVVYELRFYPNLTVTSGTISINSISYAWTQQASTVSQSFSPGISVGALGHSGDGNAAYAFGANTLPNPPSNAQSGTPYNSSSYSYAAYANGTFYRDETIVFEPAAAVISGGIGSLVYGKPSAGASNVNGGFTIAFDPKIPKTNVQTLTFVFRLSYGRYTP